MAAKDVKFHDAARAKMVVGVMEFHVFSCHVLIS